MICPNCKSTECWRDEIDIGVGVQCGPWHCADCGWYEGHEADALIDLERELDETTPVPMSEERIQEIVDYAVGRKELPERPHGVHLNE